MAQKRATSEARPETGTSAQNPTPIAAGNMLVIAMLVLAFGLFGWRAMAVFTSPQSHAPTSSASGELTALVETVTGPNKARIAISQSGAPIILVDGVEGTLSSADAMRLRSLASALNPDAPPAIIRQYVFADGTPARPNAAALGELAALAILLGLAGWSALTVTQTTRKSLPMSPRPYPSDQAPAPRAAQGLAPIISPTGEPSDIKHQNNALDRASALARDNPQATAAIIGTWLRQEGDPA